MQKRKESLRARIYFDEMDLIILELLRDSEQGLRVTDIVDKLKIQNKNLKPHIDKLRNLKLILTTQIESSPGNFEIRLITPLFYHELIGSPGFPKSATEDIIKDINFFETTLNSLNKVRTYYWKKEHDKLVNYDLRKKKQ